MSRYHCFYKMMRLLFAFPVILLSLIGGTETQENSTEFRIAILRLSDQWSVKTTGAEKLNKTNSSVVISYTYIPSGGPLVFLKSLQKHQLQSEDLYIIDGEVCKNIHTYVPLLDTPSLCHKQFSPVPPLLSPCEQMDVCPITEPPDDCNIFSSVKVNTVAKMLPDLLQTLGWRLVIIFHDQGMDQFLIHLSDQLSVSGIKLVTNEVHEGITDDQLHSIIYSFYRKTKFKNRNFLILCHGVCVNRIMNVVNDFDQRNGVRTAIWKFSKWLVFGEKMDPQLTINLTVNNVAMITLPEVIPRGNTSSKESQLADLLGSVYKRCIGDNSDMETGTKGRQMVQLLEEDTECWRGRIHTLLHKTNGRVFSQIGEFDLQGNITLTTPVFTNIKLGFNGKQLIVGTNPMNPFVINSNSSVYGFEGICIDLLAQIASTLNFTYKLVRPVDGEWGRVVNGSWTGLVKALQNWEMDLVAAPLTVSIQREEVMDFTVPFYYDHAVGVYKMPDPSRNKWMKLIKPFKGMVLACLGISLLIAATLLCIMESATTSLKHQQKVSVGNAFQESIWYLYGALLAHGGSHQPQSESGRVLVGFWWLFCIIIAASYSGTLIAFLTVNKETPPFESLAEIADQTEYKWGTTGGSSWITYFSETSVKEVAKLWSGMERFMQNDPGVVSVSSEIHYKKVTQGSYVHFGDSERLTMWTTQNCDLALTKETFYPFTYALGLPKKSPYAEIISDTMLAIDQSGLFLNWKRKWWPRQNLCLDETMQEREIEIEDLQSAFYLTAIGIVLATIILGLEKLMVIRHSKSDSGTRKPGMRV